MSQIDKFKVGAAIAVAVAAASVQIFGGDSGAGSVPSPQQEYSVPASQQSGGLSSVVTPASYADVVLDAHHPVGGPDGFIVRHKAYMISYSEEHEQPAWVMYKLSADMISGPAPRNDVFLPDDAIPTGSASSDDYVGSGYDRGHLCASADVRNDDVAHDETFFMSNVSPQVHGFNAGLWNDLEKMVRAWARAKGELYVVTGPVLSPSLPKLNSQRGNASLRDDFHGVSVPRQFFKIIYSPADGGHMIAYLMDNVEYPDGEQPAAHNAIVDDIEAVTGINFFPGVAGENKMESHHQSSKWWRGN